MESLQKENKGSRLLKGHQQSIDNPNGIVDVDYEGDL